MQSTAGVKITGYERPVRVYTAAGTYPTRVSCQTRICTVLARTRSTGCESSTAPVGSPPGLCLCIEPRCAAVSSLGFKVILAEFGDRNS